MAKGKLIILEAGDGAGKATQTKLLANRLKKEGYPVKTLSFPDYEADSSMLVRMYLGGAFGTDVSSVNAYAATTFFAVDRYASYRMKWQKDFAAGAIILADRYVTSNMAHQAVKIEDEAERDAFLAWMEDFEYEKLELPRPDLVLFLDMEPAAAEKLIAARAEKEHATKDIHEKDSSYLAHCHKAYSDLAARYQWQRIDCSRGGNPYTISEIHEDIYSTVLDRLYPERTMP